MPDQTKEMRAFAADLWYNEIDSPATVARRGESDHNAFTGGIMATPIVAERWLPVVGYEALYEVSDHGRLWSLRLSRAMKVFDNRRGYFYVKLWCGPGVSKTRSVHHLVLTAFVGPKPPRHGCDHINGNSKDNRLSNLQWVTPAENNRRLAVRHGGAPWCRCEKSSLAKFTIGQARIIRRCASMKLSRGWQVALADGWGISFQAISAVACGRKWKHMDNRPMRELIQEPSDA